MVLSVGVGWKEASKEVLYQNWVLRGTIIVWKTSLTAELEDDRKADSTGLKCTRRGKERYLGEFFGWSVRWRRRG